MDIRNKGIVILALVVFLCSTMYFFKGKPVFALEGIWIDEKQLGEMCVGQIAPSSRNIGEEIAAGDSEIPEVILQEKEAEEIKKAAEDNSGAKDESVAVTGDPLVIIYHTHSSESYMPYAESNYHREAEEGTVRDVGNVLEQELKKQGINVIHDKTVHDRPSYNDSYSRSLATIQNLAQQYPTAIYIIDLHRDAAAAAATEGKYIEIDGKRVATFSMVVGRANENYPQLSAFANKVSKKAGVMYAGFGGYILEKDYNYNEFVSDKALLLEVGNNKNTIEEARLCGEYFADVLAEVIREEQ